MLKGYGLFKCILTPAQLRSPDYDLRGKGYSHFNTPLYFNANLSQLGYTLLHLSKNDITPVTPHTRDDLTPVWLGTFLLPLIIAILTGVVSYKFSYVN